MVNEVKLEIGYGLGKGDDAFAVGLETARQALGSIRECTLSLVLVFASISYDLKELLRGVHSVVGEVPVVGATTAGEICNGPHHDSVVVTVLASPYLEVSVGLGQGVAEDWQQAVAQAVRTPGLAPFFSPDDNTAWSELTLQGKSAFALMFAPGETFTSILRSFEILEELKRLSQDRLPVIGGCAGDDLRMETNYVLYGEHAYPDSLLLVICQTQLRFGIAMAHGLKPTAQRAMVTQTHNHEVLELDGQVAAEVYSNILGHSRERLEGKHLTLVTGRPMGTLDPYGQYSINVAAYFTPSGGLRVAQPVTEGTILTFMASTPESVAAAGREALRKALLRGCITQPAVVLGFSCCLRAYCLGDRLVEETQGMEQILPDVPKTGFYSMGEQGLADDGVNRNNTAVIAVLVLGRELSYAAQVALEREGLRREVEQAEALKVAYAALEREVAERKKAEGTLRESEQRFRAMFENAADAILLADVNTKKFLMGNAMASKVLGYSQDEIRRLGVKDIHPPEALPPIVEQFERQVRREIGAAQDLPMKKKDGSIFYADVNSFPIIIEGKTYLMGIFRDVTARRQAEEEIIRQREELRGLATQLSEMQELERQQLAGELHDQVCQNLASIALNLETLRMRAQQEPPDRLLKRLSDTSNLVEQTGGIARDIMEGLRPTVLDHYGLMGGLRQLASQFSQRTGIDLEVLSEKADCRLKPNVELALFRIVQEALNNVAKHAKASQVTLTKEIDQDWVRLVIADNGTGFDQNMVAHPQNGRGWGLMTMNERAMAVGGHCRIESQPGQGTRVTVEVSR